MTLSRSPDHGDTAPTAGPKPYYADEFVTLYHGDCRELLPEIEAAAAGVCVIADPPYGETSLAWDRWPNGWVDAVGRRVSWRASLWCWGSMRMHRERRDDFAQWDFAQDFVWEKHNGSNSASDRFRRVHEIALQFYRAPWADVYSAPVYTADATARVIRRKKRPPQWGEIGESTYTSEDGGPRLMRSVFYARSEHGRAENETQKPVAVIAPLIEHSCPPNGLILSPFAGAGTDLVTAKMLGRYAIGIELREAQCEVAARRLSQNILDFGGVA